MMFIYLFILSFNRALTRGEQSKMLFLGLTIQIEGKSGIKIDKMACGAQVRVDHLI
jgi:hypothetical protein